ncbi:MAG: type II toxin-antitoxin system RelE/ParE family toxin [Ignavibacteria bacterium]|nr:type II toxin-antitoxin system RelE/ParE family toxin [Ignavibacteria bacterium]
MNYKVQVKDSAELDMLDAYYWYESEKNGLGKNFLSEIESNFLLLEANPLLYQVIYKNVRRSLLHKFPFGIYFIVDKEIINIISVAHLSRNPKEWRKRISNN